MPFERAAPDVRIDKTPPDDPELVELIRALDAELDPLYPSESQHGYPVEKLKGRNVTMFIARIDGLGRACGGVEILETWAEIKRMFVHPEARGVGLAQQILAAIEEFALEKNRTITRLETGMHQHAAIRLYQNAGYAEIGAFPPYKPDPRSVFMEKHLQPVETDPAAEPRDDASRAHFD